jgi:vacuolar-type H+-ATPase subunit H
VSAVERGPNIEILHLLDKLESLVSTGTRLPLTSRALVDEQEFVDILDEIRAAVPEEVRQAKRLSQEKEKVILQAQSEADKIINGARDEATRILQEDHLIRAAREQADAYVQEAIQRAEEVRRGADEYALAALDGLEDQLERLLATVRKGKTTLERSLHVPSAPDPAPGAHEPEPVGR